MLQKSNDFQKIESIIQGKLTSIENFYKITKRFSKRTDVFMQKLYQLIFSLLDDDLPQLELPLMNSNQWEIVEKTHNQNSQTNFPSPVQASSQQESSNSKNEGNANVLKCLQIFKDKNQEKVELVMKESSSNSDLTGYIEKLFTNLRENNSSLILEAKIEKQKQKIAFLKKKNNDLQELFFEANTKSKINESQLKALTENINATTAKLAWEQDSKNLNGLGAILPEFSVEILRQKISQLKSENEILKGEIQNSQIGFKHLEKSLKMLNTDILGLFEYSQTKNKTKLQNSKNEGPKKSVGMFNRELHTNLYVNSLAQSLFNREVPTNLYANQQTQSMLVMQSTPRNMTIEYQKNFYSNQDFSNKVSADFETPIFFAKTGFLESRETKKKKERKTEELIEEISVPLFDKYPKKNLRDSFEIKTKTIFSEDFQEKEDGNNELFVCRNSFDPNDENSNAYNDQLRQNGSLRPGAESKFAPEKLNGNLSNKKTENFDKNEETTNKDAPLDNESLGSAKYHLKAGENFCSFRKI